MKLINYWIKHDDYSKTAFDIKEETEESYITIYDKVIEKGYIKNPNKDTTIRDIEYQSIWIKEEDDESLKHQLTLYYLNKKRKIQLILNKLDGVEANE